jgi:exonuclease SbcD
MKVDNISLVTDIFRQFIDLVKSLGLKKCFHMGDFFTSRASQTLECLTEAGEILDMFENERITLYIFPGNHDKVSLIDEKSYLSVICKRRKYVKLIESETMILDTENKLKIFVLPYFKEGMEYLSRLSNLIEQNDDEVEYKKILLTHTSINGVMNNDGSVVEGDIDQDFFQIFDLVLSGHYHNRSFLSKKIVYIGSGYQSNYGEDEDKGFTIINDDLSLEFVQSKFPIYRKFVIDISDEEKAQKMLKEHSDKGNNIRFEFVGDQEQIDNFDANKYNSAGISVKYKNIIDRGVLFTEVEDASMISFDKKTVLKHFIMYANQQQYDKKQMKRGMELINEIQF